LFGVSTDPFMRSPSSPYIDHRSNRRRLIVHGKPVVLDVLASEKSQSVSPWVFHRPAFPNLPTPPSVELVHWFFSKLVFRERQRSSWLCFNPQAAITIVPKQEWFRLWVPPSIFDVFFSLLHFDRLFPIRGH